MLGGEMPVGRFEAIETAIAFSKPILEILVERLLADMRPLKPTGFDGPDALRIK